MYENLTEENERHRAYLVETFGPDVTVGLDPLYPTTGDTAQKLAAPSLAAARERQQAQDVELVQLAATEQDEDESLALAIRKTRNGGGKLPPGTLAKAGRALRRRGYHRGTTAEQIARMAGQGQGWRST